MTLQVIKAEDVRDGEPRWYCRDKTSADAAIAANAVGLFVRSDVRAKVHRGFYPLAIVDRPAPSAAVPANRFDCAKCGQAVKADEDGCCATCGRDCTIIVDGAQPPPVLDLDALAEAERAMTAGPWKFANNTTFGIIGSDSRDLKAWHWHKSGDGADRRGVVALRNAAPHLIAEARAAVALRAEIARLTAELAAARAVPPDVEAAIESTVDGAEEAGRCAALGHAYLITKAPFWTVPRLKDTIARDKAAAVEAAVTRTVEEARVLADEIRAKFTPASKPATVGGLLATAPVGAIVEWLDGDGDWNQAVALVDDRIPCAMHRWWMAGRWCQYGGFDDAGRHLRLPARLVPAHLADADPASRGPIEEG